MGATSKNTDTSVFQGFVSDLFRQVIEKFGDVFLIFILFCIVL